MPLVFSLLHGAVALLKWLFILIGGILLLLAGMGLIGHVLRMRNAPPYQMVDIDEGRRLHVHCEGPEGAPFVLYDAGAFGIYTDGWWIKEELKADFRVCLYDRAGMGWSDPVPDGISPTPDWHVSEIRRLRTALSETQPFIFVGHSMAGLRLHAYANLHSDELRGLVFIDAASPQAIEESRVRRFLNWAKPVLNVGIGLTRLGIMGGISCLMPDELDLPKQQAADKSRSISAVGHHRATKAEILSMLAIDPEADWFKQTRAESLPVAVYSNTPGGGRSAATAEGAKAKSGFGKITALPDETHVSLLNRTNAKLVAADVRAIQEYSEVTE